MEKYGFIYIWYDRKRKMYYIGCHWGTEDDGYICSSNRMRNAYNRRPEDFKRRILQRNVEKTLLFATENAWLSLIKESELSKRYYNAKNHIWHWTAVSKESTTEKLKRIHSSPEMKAIHSEAGKKNKGIIRSDDFKMKVSEGMKRYTKTKEHISNVAKALKGKPTWITGKKHSEETKEKMRKSQMGRKHSEETRKKMALAARNRKTKKEIV